MLPKIIAKQMRDPIPVIKTRVRTRANLGLGRVAKSQAQTKPTAMKARSG
jgi:hypothetical protein